jgi:hypothetical protein
MRQTADTTLDGMIYNASLIKIGSGVQNLEGGSHSDIHADTDSKMIS